MRRLSALIEPLAEGLSVAVLLALMLFAMLGKMPLAGLVTFIFMLYRGYRRSARIADTAQRLSRSPE